MFLLAVKGGPTEYKASGHNVMPSVSLYSSFIGWLVQVSVAFKVGELVKLSVLYSVFLIPIQIECHMWLCDRQGRTQTQDSNTRELVLRWQL